MMALEQSYDIPLHDIKPIVEVQEYSLYYFLALSFAALFLVAAIGYLLYKWLQKRSAFNLRKEHYRLLGSLDLKSTKESAYLVTSLGATFKDDSPRHKEMYENLTERLEKYKYKKEVDEFDKEILGYIELYKEMIDV